MTQFTFIELVGKAESAETCWLEELGAIGLLKGLTFGETIFGEIGLFGETGPFGEKGTFGGLIGETIFRIVDEFDPFPILTILKIFEGIVILLTLLDELNMLPNIPNGLLVENKLTLHGSVFHQLLF